MKKKQIKFDKKLSFDKETIARLNDEQLKNVEGGQTIASVTCNKASEEQADALPSCVACSCNGTA